MHINPDHGGLLSGDSGAKVPRTGGFWEKSRPLIPAATSVLSSFCARGHLSFGHLGRKNLPGPIGEVLYQSVPGLCRGGMVAGKGTSWRRGPGPSSVDHPSPTLGLCMKDG